MTAKIKLNAASGGGSISIQAPSSSSNNRVIALPDIADGTLVTSESTLDATKLSGNLPALNGSALTNLPGGGKLLQIVQDTRTSQLSSSSHSSNVAISGLSVSITPSASTSKVLVLVTITHGFSGNSVFMYRLLRGSTALNTGTTAPSSSSPVNAYIGTVAGKSTATRGHPVNITFLDEPNTTSATTYSLTIKHNSGTWYLNTRDGNYAGASSIQAIEIGA